MAGHSDEQAKDSTWEQLVNCERGKDKIPCDACYKERLEREYTGMDWENYE